MYIRGHASLSPTPHELSFASGGGCASRKANMFAGESKSTTMAVVLSLEPLTITASLTNCTVALRHTRCEGVT